MWKTTFSVISLVVLLYSNGSNSIFWKRRRRSIRRPICSPRNCLVSSWSAWSACSQQCGTSGSQRRARSITVSASCGGSCPYHLSERRACNRANCRNGGTPHSRSCSCRPGYQGTCCERGKILPTFSPRFLPPPYLFGPFLPPPYSVPQPSTKLKLHLFIIT